MKQFSPSLSPLEHDVLSRLWAGKPMLVRDVYASIRRSRRVAQSSIAVILDRLHSKRLVGRRSETCRGGVRYWYFAKTPRNDFVQGAVDSAISSLVERYGTSAISYFEERFSKSQNRNLLSTRRK